jgi:hypothetical protein
MLSDSNRVREALKPLTYSSYYNRIPAYVLAVGRTSLSPREYGIWKIKSDHVPNQGSPSAFQTTFSDFCA